MSPARCTATLLLLLSAAVSACGDDSEPRASETRRMQTPNVHQPIDAGAADAVLIPEPHDAPAGDFHLDTASTGTWQPTRKRSAPGRTLRLTLRSTPPSAMATVDGMRIGPTPTYWEGPATGKPRNFVFTLRGHAMARYRFVPTTDGVVHATLKKLVVDPTDAGVTEQRPAPASPPPR